MISSLRYFVTSLYRHFVILSLSYIVTSLYRHTPYLVTSSCHLLVISSPRHLIAAHFGHFITSSRRHFVISSSCCLVLSPSSFLLTFSRRVIISSTRQLVNSSYRHLFIVFVVTLVNSIVHVCACTRGYLLTTTEQALANINIFVSMCVIFMSYFHVFQPLFAGAVDQHDDAILSLHANHVGKLLNLYVLYIITFYQYNHHIVLPILQCICL